MPVVGFLSGRSPASDAELVAAFRRALSESGFVEGQNVAIEFRWADGRLDQLPALAAELIERKVAVLFAGASESLSGALRVAAASVPVVFATAVDPVAAHLIASLNRPGRNLTGFTVISAALWPKRLEVLRELISPTPEARQAGTQMGHDAFHKSYIRFVDLIQERRMGGVRMVTTK
jgi:putative ABC transport system substrate-binding protein